MRIITRLPNNPFGLVSLDQIDKFEKNDIFHLFDSFDDTVLSKMFDVKGLPKYIINDCHTFFESNEYKIFCCPFSTSAEVDKFIPKIKFNTSKRINNISNFMINKKRISRFLCIKFVEMFNLDVNYSWSGNGRTEDLTAIINELKTLPGLFSNQNINFILKPLELSKNWIEIEDKNFPLDEINLCNWENGISKIFEETGISLITESLNFHRAAQFSEKTFFSMLGMNFPIWIGGLNQPKEWEKLGFDIFSDIIDHSYQDRYTLIERCFYAFKLNLKLLTDFDLVQELRISNWERLQNNKKKLANRHLYKSCCQIIESWPIDLQPAAKILANLPISFN